MIITVALGNVLIVVAILLAAILGGLWPHKPELPQYIAMGLPAFCAFAAAVGAWFAGVAWSDLTLNEREGD
jgi:hypothetical protein